jgi:UDP-2-acetamido-3-amino-2,3-dideoxy-glucuronate N-acetyltransferase
MSVRERNVAVVGVGYWGRNLARNFAELGALAAVVDNDAASAQSVAASTGAEARALSDVLADSAIAGIAVATSAPTHNEVGQAALRAGKHLYVEKPLVLDEGEADRLITLAEKLGLVLMVGHLLRYHPVFQRMLELVRSGEYGPLRYIHSDRMSLGKVRREENVLWSFAPHDISMALALAGEEPDRVTAQGARFLNPSIEDIATVQLGFPGGVEAGIRVSWIHFRKLQQIVAVCDRGSIVFDDSEPEWGHKLAVYEHSIDRSAGVPVPKRADQHYVEAEFAEPLRCECQHFLDRIADGRSPLTDGREGRAVLRVLQRASVDLARTRADTALKLVR